MAFLNLFNWNKVIQKKYIKKKYNNNEGEEVKDNGLTFIKKENSYQLKGYSILKNYKQAQVWYWIYILFFICPTSILVIIIYMIKNLNLEKKRIVVFLLLIALNIIIFTSILAITYYT